MLKLPARSAAWKPLPLFMRTRFRIGKTVCIHSQITLEFHYPYSPSSEEYSSLDGEYPAIIQEKNQHTTQ